MGATTQKALCVSTRCTSVDQFVATFHRFCEDDTFFIATLSQRPVGLDTAFSIQLADKTPVLRGDCTVIEAWSTPINRFGRPGVRLSLKRLTAESRLVLQRLQDAAAAAAAAPATSTIPTAEIPPSVELAPSTRPALRAPTVPPVRPAVTTTQPLPSISIPERAATPPPTPPRTITPVPSIARGTAKTPPVAAPVAPEPTRSPLSALAKTLEAQRAARRTEAPPPPAPIAEPVAVEPPKPLEARVEERVAGSSFVLPANPLSNLTDQSIEGFVDCALYEEPASFVRADGSPDTLEPIDNVATFASPMGHPSTIPPPMGHPSTIPPPMAGRPTTIPPPLSGAYPLPPTGVSGQFLLPMPVPMAAPVMPELNPAPVAGASGVYPLPPPGMSGPFYLPQSGVSGQFLLPQAPPPLAPAPTDEAYLRTGMMRTVSPASDRRWYVIGGAAGATILLMIIIGLATSGGRKPAVKTAAAEPTRAMTSRAPVRKSSPVDAPRVEQAKPAPKVEAQVPAPIETPPPPPAEPVEPDEAGPTSDAPPEVGSGPCSYVVSSTPAGSIVSFDGRIMGPSPLTIRGACGRHRLDVKHPRYALGTKWATATEAKPATVEVPLARPTHTIAFTTIPSGATISIGGRRAGTSPTTIKVMGFQGVNVTFERKGYKKVTQKIYSKKDNERISVRLSR